MNSKEISNALAVLTPGATWNLRGDDLSGLEWLDINQVRPTDEAIIATIAAYVPPPTMQEQIATLQAQVAALLAVSGH